VAVRHYIVNSSVGFDGTTPAPTNGWTPLMVGTANALSWQTLTPSGPIGRFSRKTLGIPDTHHAIIRVVGFATPEPTDTWYSKSSGDAADGAPPLSPRNPPRVLIQNPELTLGMELFPRDELIVETTRGQCIDIAVNDLSEAEYAAYTNTLLIASKQCCAEPTVANFDVTAAGALPSPTAELNFYHVALVEVPGTVLIPVGANVTYKQQLFIIDESGGSVIIRAPAAHTVNGIASGTDWVTLTDGLGVLVRKNNTTSFVGVQGILEP
jgi:hypothetical protein